MVLGVTGKIGSGKTLCCEILEKEYKAKVYSCDKIAKEIIENKETDYEPLPQSLFFRSEAAQEECRQKIHKIVFDRIDESIKKFKLTNDNTLIVVECALPSERLFEICDKLIYVRNSYENKVKLLKEKRSYDEEITKLIYDSQKYYDKCYEKADIIIDNDGTKLELENKLKEVMNEIYIIRK